LSIGTQISMKAQVCGGDFLPQVIGSSPQAKRLLGWGIVREQSIITEE